MSPSVEIANPRCIWNWKKKSLDSKQLSEQVECQFFSLNAQLEKITNFSVIIGWTNFLLSVVGNWKIKYKISDFYLAFIFRNFFSHTHKFFLHFFYSRTNFFLSHTIFFLVHILMDLDSETMHQSRFRLGYKLVFLCILMRFGVWDYVGLTKMHLVVSNVMLIIHSAGHLKDGRVVR